MYGRRQDDWLCDFAVGSLENWLSPAQPSPVTRCLHFCQNDIHGHLPFRCQFCFLLLVIHLTENQSKLAACQGCDLELLGVWQLATSTLAIWDMKQWHTHCANRNRKICYPKSGKPKNVSRSGSMGSVWNAGTAARKLNPELRTVKSQLVSSCSRLEGGTNPNAFFLQDAGEGGREWDGKQGTQIVAPWLWRGPPRPKKEKMVHSPEWLVLWMLWRLAQLMQASVHAFRHEQETATGLEPWNPSLNS